MTERTHRTSPPLRSWSFMFPVGELILTEAVGREFRIDRVTLVHKDKLPHIRKRLGLGVRVSDLKRIIRGWGFFDTGEAFAVVRQSGDPEEIEPRALEMIREELSILAVSQLGYHKRNQMGLIVAPGEVPHPYITYLAVSSQDSIRFGNLLKRTAPFGQVVLDGRWKNYQDNVFFTKLLKILRGETEVEEGWRRELRRATLMIGESIGTTDLLKSFLWNWVALETLLTRQQDKVEDMLPKRAEALLGWARTYYDTDTTLWHAEGYESRIRNVYRRRNALLRQGNREGITEQDVEFTDHLLLNLLSNLVSFPKLFRSKSVIISFSEKVEAENVLGIRPRVRPKDLSFVASLPGPESRLEIEYRIGEWWNLPQSWRDDAQRYDEDPRPEPEGYFFRVTNSSVVSVSVPDAHILAGAMRVTIAKSRLPQGRRLEPGESAIFIVPGWELARELLENGRSGSAWAKFRIRESIRKRHEKSFEVTHIEQRAASVSTPEDLE